MAAKQEEQTAGRLQDKIDHSMLQSRRIFICSPITDEIAEDTIKKLWYLEETQPGKPILIVINSPGGSVDAGFAIWDQIKMITSPITTCVSGMAASMGSILMLSAPKERRFVTPNSRIMIHQPRLSGPVQGQADDLEIRAREIIKTKQMLIDLYVECTGKKKADIEKAIDRDTWYSAQEAKDFGFFAKVVSSYKDLGL